MQMRILQAAFRSLFDISQNAMDTIELFYGKHGAGVLPRARKAAP